MDLLVSLNDALANFGVIDDHTIVISGYFNFIYDTSLDARGGNPTLKLRSLAQITKICEKYDLCDIFRIRHPDSKRFTFRTKNGKIHRRLDHFLVSNIAQETVHAVCILPSVKSDHSPILLSIKDITGVNKGPGLWKFNNLLLGDDDFCQQLNDKLDKVIVESKKLADPQIIWEFIKFEIRVLSIDFAKQAAKKRKKQNQIFNKLLKTSKLLAETLDILNMNI